MRVRRANEARSGRLKEKGKARPRSCRDSEAVGSGQNAGAAAAMRVRRANEARSGRLKEKEKHGRGAAGIRKPLSAKMLVRLRQCE